MHSAGVFKSVILAALLVVGFAPAAFAQAFVVNSTDDIADNVLDGVCATPAPSVCTLRAAIQEANAVVGPDQILVPPGTYTSFTIRVTDDLGQTADQVTSITVTGTTASVTGAPPAAPWNVAYNVSFGGTGNGARRRIRSSWWCHDFAVLIHGASAVAGAEALQ